MGVTADDVNKIVFSLTRFGRVGYDQDEVDDFLDKVTDEMRALAQRAQDAELRASASAQTIQIPAAPSAAPVGGVQQVELLLKVAQETADKVVADARGAAYGVAATAANEAAAVAQKAKADADAVLGAAHTEAANLLAAARSEQQALAAKVDELKATHLNVSGLLKGALAKLEEL